MEDKRVPHASSGVLAESADVVRLRAVVDRLRELEADRDAYRELAQTAVHALHELTVERDRLQRQVCELRELTRRAVERAA